MTLLGNGLLNADHFEDALSVQEARLSLLRRLGASEEDILVVQANLAMVYGYLGRNEEALQIERDVYSGRLRLLGEEDRDTLASANNYADSLVSLNRFEEAKALLRKVIPLARRALGTSHEITLRMRENYARALHKDNGATLKELRKAVTTLEDAERIARRVLGGAHPLTVYIEKSLKNARAALRAREAPPTTASRWRGARLARLASRPQFPLCPGARRRARAARSVPCPQASSRPRGDR